MKKTKLSVSLLCFALLLSACGVEGGNQRPEEKKLQDSIKLLITYMERSHPDLVNWNKEAVSAQLKRKLPVGYATDAGWTIKWNNPASGELPQAVVAWELLGQFPSKTILDINDYNAGNFAQQSIVSEISRLQSNNDPYFAAVVNIKVSKKDSKWVAFTSIPYLPVTDPAYGWAHSENGKWQIVDFGSAMVGCGKVPNEIQSEFGFSCPNN